MAKRRKGPGLFSSWWHTMDGRRLRKIRRDEYGELYRLHRIGGEMGLLKKHKPGASDPGLW